MIILAAIMVASPLYLIGISLDKLNKTLKEK